MKFKALVAAGMSVSLLVLPVQQARANDLARGLAVLGIGAAIGSAIQHGRAQAGTRTTTTRSTGSTGCGAACQAQRQEVRETQTALNHFGYNAGPVDGIQGRGTRGAISRFEAEMGFVADGNLEPHERSFLMSSYYRATSGNLGPHGQALATGGQRGLLRSFNEERMGRFGTAAAYGTTGAVQTGTANGQFGTQPVAGQTAVGPSGVTPTVPSTTVVDPFAQGFNVQPMTASMSEHCAQTNQYTRTNGGFITLATAATASQALSEQFCLAREYTQQKGQAAMASIAGMTAEDVVALCGQYADALAAPLELLASQPRAAVLAEIETVAAQMPAPQRAQAGEICMSVGYDRDDPRMALAAALLAVAGERPSYGEVVGHHLREGFGTAANAQLAKGWHLDTIAEMDRGAPADILPNQAMQRNVVIRGAYGEEEAAVSPAINMGGQLPTFVVQQ